MKRFAIITTCLVLSLVAIQAVAQSKDLKAKQNSLTKSLNQVKQKRNQIQSQLRQAEAKTKKMMDDIHRVDRQISDLATKIDETNEQLEEAKLEQQELGAELRSKTVELDEMRTMVKKRLRSIYAQGESSSLSLIVGTQSIGDLATRQALVERIADRDREMFTKVKTLRDVILAKKKEQDRIVAKIADLNASHKAKVEELQTARLEKKDIYSILKAQEDLLEEQYKQMQNESRTLERQIFEIQAKNGGTPIFKGKFITPVSGARISSRFGSRVHPISRRRKMHNGVDYAASTGTAIRAAGSGKVITASYRNGYGNTVVIDHGGKISTLYGHCSRLYVKVGQYVKQGERIAAVGSTGYSTGPHLHFEVRVNGKPVDPLGRL